MQVFRIQTSHTDLKRCWSTSHGAGTSFWDNSKNSINNMFSINSGSLGLGWFKTSPQPLHIFRKMLHCCCAESPHGLFLMLDVNWSLCSISSLTHLQLVWYRADPDSQLCLFNDIYVLKKKKKSEYVLTTSPMSRQGFLFCNFKDLPGWFDQSSLSPLSL